ncbi:nitroreductase family protein [Alkalilacustris brevis]|uniref:nitroreductase family protein n=1 Tax=Alkalilacustris brevis TaxID=2026338 RepID=UPI000E0D0115|nr:nitroreductase family protein [Alkalilacustris brevis]
MPEQTRTAEQDQIIRDLAERFGTTLRGGALPGAGASLLAHMAGHRVHRRFEKRPVPDDLLRLLCACALSAPSKSDLQQRDIIVVDDPEIRARIAERTPRMTWMHEAPAFVVFCANGRRLPQIAAWRDKPFPNDHFDLLFNSIGDAAIALAWFQIAVESAGLGGCPISEIRNFADDLSEWLDLPERVIPYAGFCLGWPAEPGQISPRLPLEATLHRNRFSEAGLQEQIDSYDQRRAALQPATRQRAEARWGHSDSYGWSEDKARQYAEPLRDAFGAFVRGKGFSME